MDMYLLTSLILIGLCLLVLIGLGIDRWRLRRSKHAH